MTIQIPPRFQHLLEPRDDVDKIDKRTDEEIINSLREYKPITSEKNIWTFWDSGIEGMPAWCRRNVVGWVRINGPEWTIRIIDDIPDSPNYAGKYIPKGLPDSFYAGTMDGTHPGPHKADFLRGACLYEYGGAWVDSSTFGIRTMDDVCWNQLEDPDSPYRVAVPVFSNGILNCFVAARKHDPFIKRWQEIFMAIWEGHTNSNGLAKHPLLANVIPYWLKQFEEHIVGGMGLTVDIEKVAEYGAQMVCWHRLYMLEDAGDGFSGADYWPKNVLWIKCNLEILRPFYIEGSEVPDFQNSRKRFEELALKVDGPKDTKQYQEAEEMVWTALTESSMVKIGTIKGMVDWVSLSSLWNSPEGLGKDAEPGTFADLLRTVPLQYRQQRRDIRAFEGKKYHTTLKKGHLEP
ncbi:hypothetical protein NPX13_g1361 [Xylaria arbuscula]|uniref:Capsule polysaccharide biosynthesis protein n=1 Tax=Xylaria arbuscula TaxID=114810 RepID=A0A9W8NM55_9PEZI|nr:hypothetical protein NPX13_g1361 [Xylaria arbuscula]